MTVRHPAWSVHLQADDRLAVASAMSADDGERRRVGIRLADISSDRPLDVERRRRLAVDIANEFPIPVREPPS